MLLCSALLKGKENEITVMRDFDNLHIILLNHVYALGKTHQVK